MKITKEKLKNIIIEEATDVIVDSKAILKDRNYITDVLGVNLPVVENKYAFLSESKKAEILQEKMLHENFLKSLYNGAKQSTGKIKKLLVSLYGIMKDGNKLKSYFVLLRTKVINKIANQFRKIFNRMKQLGGIMEQLGNKMSEMLEKLIQKVKSMSVSWKAAMIGTTMALLLTWAYGKISGLADDLQGEITDQLADKFKEFFKEKFAQLFGQKLLDKILAKITDIKSYLGWVGPIVGGLSFVADTLVPVTTRMTAPQLRESKIKNSL